MVSMKVYRVSIMAAVSFSVLVRLLFQWFILSEERLDQKKLDDKARGVL